MMLCITKKCLERAESVGEAWSLACDAVVSQRKASKEQSRLVKLALLPYDATASQNKAVEELS